MAQSFLSMPMASFPAHFLGISHVFFLTPQEFHCGIKIVFKCPIHDWNKQLRFVERSCKCVSVCNKCDLKWGPLKVYSWCPFLKHKLKQHFSFKNSSLKAHWSPACWRTRCFYVSCLSFCCDIWSICKPAMKTKIENKEKNIIVLSVWSQHLLQNTVKTHN